MIGDGARSAAEAAFADELRGCLITGRLAGAGSIQTVCLFDELSESRDESSRRGTVDDVVIHTDREAEMLTIDNGFIDEDRMDADIGSLLPTSGRDSTSLE